MVLLNLTLFWWFRDQPPFPRSSIIARRMGVSARTVQRVFRKLEQFGYVRRGHWRDAEGNIVLRAYFKHAFLKQYEKFATSCRGRAAVEAISTSLARSPEPR